MVRDLVIGAFIRMRQRYFPGSRLKIAPVPRFADSPRNHQPLRFFSNITVDQFHLELATHWVQMVKFTVIRASVSTA